MTPNKANIKLWVEALRSGLYDQGFEALRTSTGEYCCLGVACDISGLGEWRENTYLGGGQSLPEAVSHWLGVAGDDVNIGGTWASARNDQLKQSFQDIADLIERQYLT